jgi:crotonobetainyl-CoA:carnitine CoA-transferase CaiB-like acyl-CoA transferase
MTGALEGLRVVDLTRVLSGPFCTMVLADLGAEVVKVEPPEGDPARGFAPFDPADELRAFGGYFQSINRGKQSVVLDLRAPDDLKRALDLCGTADVVVENFRPGVLDRLGLGWRVLHALKPSLVLTSVTGFGQAGSPYLDRPAYDITAQALGGLMSITGPADGPPHKAGPGLGDIVPGLFAAIGTLAAVHHARATGQGQHVDVAMYDAVLAVSERIVHQHSYTGEVPGMQGNQHPLLAPFEVLRAVDGWVTLAAPDASSWRALTQRVPGLDREAWKDNAGRLADAAPIRRLLQDWVGSRTTGEVDELLADAVPVSAVQDVAAIVRDPHAVGREMVVPLPHPGLAGTREVAGCPIKMSLTPTRVDRRAPLLGEHAEQYATTGALP